MSIEETIRVTVEQSLSSILPAQMEYLKKVLKGFEEKISLRTYSIHEASQETKIGINTLYKAAKNGTLPTFMIGKIRRVKHTDLQEYIEKMKQKNKPC